MNTFKKIISVITVVFVVIRLFIISVSASFAAPIMAEETLKTILIEGMVAGGSDYTKDDLEAWELDDLENEFEIQMSTNPNFNLKKALPPLVSGDISDVSGSPEHIAKLEEEKRKYKGQIGKVLSDWINYMQSNGEDLYDFINPTYNSPYIDIPSSGAVIEITDSLDQHRIIYLNDYGLKVLTSDGRSGFMIRQNIMARQVIYDKYGKLVSDKSYDTPNNAQTTYTLNSASIKSIQIYGDWRYDEDTPAETDDEAVPVIGEVAGTQVTPDMLNPDGTVTIDGTTYSPIDFIDWDKFKDNAIIDLLNDILSKIDTAPIVSEQDKPLVDVDEIEVSVPEELSDYAAPIGISNVFPFCIPWDIVRGFQILNRPSVTPKLEIPFNIPEFGLFDGVEETITIDFTEYDKYVQIFRWFQILGFSFLLCKLSLTRVKGAGA